MKNRPRKNRNIPLASDANVPLALNEPDAARRAHHPLWMAAAIVVVLAASVMFVRFALDVYLILLVFVCGLFVFHSVMKMLFESQFVGLRWLIIFALTVIAVIGIFAPAETFQDGVHLEKLMPQRLVKFMEWGEKRGLTRRALGASTTGSESTGAAGSRSELGGALAQGGGPQITLNSSQPVSGVGRPITITATLRFAALPASGTPLTVRFYDDRVFLGSGLVAVSGNSGFATLTIPSLPAGTHSITATYGSGGFLNTAPSAPFQQIVR